MFDAVSVFQAPFLPAGAADALGIERTHALELLSALVERSLVHRAGDRYGVYESLRQLGAEHLGRRRHGRRRAGAPRPPPRGLRRHRLEPVCGCPATSASCRSSTHSVADLRAAERWFAEHGTVEERLRFALDLRDYGFYRMRPEVLGWAENAARVPRWPRAWPSGLAGEAFAAASLEAWNRGDLERGTELIRLGPRRGGGHRRGPRLLRAREHRAPRA